MKRLILPISTLLLMTIGCDNPMIDDRVELDNSELQDFSSELSSDLGLSKTSANAVNGILNKHGRGGKHRAPGFLWKVADELADKLSGEEKARLFEKMEEKEIPLFSNSKGKKGKGKKGGKNHKDFNGVVKVLTDDQKVTFKAIIAAYKEKFKAVHEQVKDGTLTKEDAKTELDALREAMNAEVDALLTDDQKAQLDQNKADHEAKRQAYKDSSKAVMTAVLGMTSEQLSEFDTANQEARDAANALFEKAKNGDIDKDTLREGLKAIFVSKNEKMSNIFDNGQLEIIKIHKALEMRMKKHKSGKGKMRGGKKGLGGKKGSKG